MYFEQLGFHDINMNFSIALKTILQGLIVPIIKSDIEFRDITASAAASLCVIMILPQRNVSNSPHAVATIDP